MNIETLYNPELIAKQGFLNDRIDSKPVDTNEETDNTIRRSLINPNASDSIVENLKPLTVAESEYIDKEIAALDAYAEKLNVKIDRINSFISTSIEQSSKDLPLSVPTASNKSLRKAIKTMFGKNTETITYQMYLVALAARNSLEKQGIADYVGEK